MISVLANKTKKIIALLLLANLALAGALFFLFPTGRPLASLESPSARPPVKVVTGNTRYQITPMADVSSAETKPSGPTGDLHDWIVRDPHAAIKWASQQPADEKREGILEAACYEIANSNPAEAIVLAEKFALTKHATLANLTAQWAQKDLPTAREWALAKPEGDEKNDLLARVAYVWASTDPKNAAHLVVEKMSPGNAQTEAAISVLHQWALRDLEGARAWVELFPDSDLRDRAINELNGVRDYSLAEKAQKANVSPSGEPAP